MASESVTLAYYAAFLFGSGLAGFAMSGFQSKARSSLIMGSATAAVIALLSVLHRRPARPTKLYSTVRHVAPIVVFLFACVFAWRAHLLVGSREKQYLLLLLAAMCVGSIYVFVSLLISHAADNDRIRLAAEGKKR